MSLAEIQEHYRSTRARLRNPPNAVPDHGIDLKRKIEPTAPPIIETAIHVETAPIPYNIGSPFCDIKVYYDEIPALPPLKHIRIDVIQREVCRHFGLSLHDLLSDRRTAHIVWPRQVAMHLCKRITLKSLPYIGRKFGGRDHTTVIHAVRKIERLRATDAVLHAELLDLENKLRGA